MIEDHPIFLKSISFIKSKLLKNNFSSIELQVLERLIHTSGDFGIQKLLKFSKNACENGILAIQNRAPILTDTDMAAAAVRSMAKNTHGNSVFSAKQWIDEDQIFPSTKTAYGIERAWLEISQNYSIGNSPIVIFGSSPTALEKLLDILPNSHTKPSLIIGMPVGFIGVEQSKRRLVKSRFPYVVLNSTRGGAAMAGAAVNALLRASV